MTTNVYLDGFSLVTVASPALAQLPPRNAQSPQRPDEPLALPYFPPRATGKE